MLITVAYHAASRPAPRADEEAGDSLAAGPPAVVIGLGSIVGLQTARILASRNVRVVGVTGNRRHFAARTRACEHVVQADVDGEQLLDALAELGPGLGGEAVLYPCTDFSVLTVSAHRHRLAPWYRVVLPLDDVVRTLTDKVRFAEHAQRCGLPVPTTFTLRSRDDARYAASQLRYPVVLKPGLKSPLWKSQTSAKALRVASADGLLKTYDRVGRWAESLVVQEYVDGGDDELFTVNAYFGADGLPLVTFVTRKERQWPPHLGIASYARECRNDDVLAHTIRLFSSLPFRGLGYLEMKRDVNTGGYLMIEANIGRPTGRSATAESGGVELLGTMYCDALGLPLPDGRTQTYGEAAWLDLRRDVLSAVHYWRQGELTPLAWLRSLRGPKAHAVLSLRDPVPFASELWQSGGKAGRRVAARTWSGLRSRSADR